MKSYVVMPVINCLDYTREAYESVKLPHEWGFILVDQDSSDGTMEWVQTLDSKRTIYIHNKPRIALAAAWNQAVKRAFEDPECEYVFICNNDVLYNPKTLSNMIEFMDETGYLLISADNISDRMSANTLMSLELPKPFTDYDLQKIEGWRSEGPDFSTFLINRDTIRIIGWFDENFKGAYCEDQDYHVRIARAREHIQKHNDAGIDPGRIYAKRLSTAPYYHYASGTIKKNEDLRPEIRQMHARNENYYMVKWGADHSSVMDGMGNQQPFGDATKNWRDYD